MSIKKSLIAVGTVAAVAVAGTGVAAADYDPEAGNKAPTSSIAGSVSNGALDPSGSIDAGGFFNQLWTENGAISGEGAVNILLGTAIAAGAVTTIAGAYTAVVGASDVYQKTVDDTLAFLASQGIKF